MPAVRAVASGDVLGEGDRRRRRQRHVVVVVEDDEAAEPEVGGERARLALQALHHVAVRGEDVGEMLEELVPGPVVARGEVGLTQGHSERVADALPERAGRCFDAVGDVALRMARSLAPPLPEPFDLIEREIVARQMEQRVEERRSVPRGENEAVAIPPAWVLRVVTKKARPKDVSHGSRPHRQPGMTRVRRLDHVDREEAERVDARLIELRWLHGCLLGAVGWGLCQPLG